MKLLWRTLIILLAVTVVAGATLGAMQLPTVQTWIESQGGGHGGPPGMTEGEFTGVATFTAEADNAAGSSEEATAGAGITAAAATGEQTRPMRGEGGEGGHNSGGNLAGLVEVAKNLGIVVAVSLAIGFINWGTKWLRPHRPLPAAAA